MIPSEKSDCSGCYACISACPVNCISMKEDKEGFWYPESDKSQCLNCGICERICDTKKVPVEEKETKYPIVYAAYSKKKEIREKSSSGGIFSLLAEYVLSYQGVIFGAAMTNQNKTAEHIEAVCEQQVAQIRGSKYLQSRIGDSYKQAKNYLDNGRLVLFTGTPCQISGLFSYLGKEYQNLITQDIICHGVPSPLVWRKYLEMCEKKEKSPVQKVFFRDKTYGWKKYSLFIQYKNGVCRRQSIDKDWYIKGFLSNWYLRPSCYHCAFKTIHRQSDITLADFWGVQEIMPEMDDNKGISLIFLHSKKGEDIWEKIKDKLIYKETSADTVIPYNTAMIQSVAEPENRTLFWQEMNKTEKIKSVFIRFHYSMRLVQWKRKIYQAGYKVKKRLAKVSKEGRK